MTNWIGLSWRFEIGITWRIERNAQFLGDVDKAQAEAHYPRIERIIPENVRQFKLLTEFSQVKQMDLGIKDAVQKAMDFLNKRGIREVIRVIPDPAQDIGFNIWSAFHYSKDVKIRTFESREEALKTL